MAAIKRNNTLKALDRIEKRIHAIEPEVKACRSHAVESAHLELLDKLLVLVEMLERHSAGEVENPQQDSYAFNQWS